MKKYSLAIAAITALASCKKKTKGIFYCEFYGGSESEYDYRHLSHDQQ